MATTFLNRIWLGAVSLPQLTAHGHAPTTGPEALPPRTPGFPIRETVAWFGAARLVRLENGRHELQGGTPLDRTNAREWISLFGHEILL